MDSHAQPRGLALCSANRPVYSILPRNASGTPGQPYEASEPIVAHVTKAIDICRLMLIQPDVLHAFHEIVWRYDVQNEKCWCFERNATTNEEVTRTFISKIVLAFPLVFVDYTLNNPDSKGFHTRRPWDGDFEPGHQSISINGKRAEHMLAAFETATLDSGRYQNFLFMTVNVLLLEIGHVYITYLSRGQEEEPRKRIKGLRGPFATVFDEADRALQDKLFNGRIHYFRDPISGTPDDQCGTPHLETVFLGFPDAGAYYRILRKPIEDIARLSELLTISKGSVSPVLFTNDNASLLEFTSTYEREESPEKEKLKTLGEGHPPDTYTDPLEEKEAAWLLKEYTN